MSDELRALRTTKNIPVKDMVEVVKPLYPKYDKTVQSKCENGDAYGVQLRDDAMEALYKAFDPEALARKRKKKDHHKLTCRIACRLDDATYMKLISLIRQDGFLTVQDWIKDQVLRYLKKKGVSVDAGTGSPDNSKLRALRLSGR